MFHAKDIQRFAAFVRVSHNGGDSAPNRAELAAAHLGDEEQRLSASQQLRELNEFGRWVLDAG
jgi:hypothetical protein